MQTTLLIVAVLLICCIMYFKRGWFVTKKNIAIRGYDPVDFFIKGRAVKGNTKFSLVWDNKLWKFSSHNNLEDFKMAPEKYVPQYDGNCAYGCSESHITIANPRVWTIVEGKLYFNYSSKYKKIWLKDVPNRVIAADAFWTSSQLLKWPVLNNSSGNIISKTFTNSLKKETS